MGIDEWEEHPNVIKVPARQSLKLTCENFSTNAVFRPQATSFVFAWRCSHSRSLLHTLTHRSAIMQITSVVSVVALALSAVGGATEALVGVAANAADDVDRVVQVAVYVGKGASTRGKKNIPIVLNYNGTGINATAVTAEFIADGGLDHRDNVTNATSWDVVFFPGGGGTSESDGLSEKGRDAVKRFVAGGGGYVGVCAGAYLASQHLHISAFEDEPRPTEGGKARGDGNCTLATTPNGTKHLPLVHPVSLEGLYVFYANGPVMRPKPLGELSPNITSAEQLVMFTSDSVPIERNYTGPWAGKGAVAVGWNLYGRGRVLISGPHPETDPMDMPDTDGPPSEPGTARAQLLQSYVLAVAPAADARALP